jgi:DNA-binding IclR family transcriptional regulator
VVAVVELLLASEVAMRVSDIVERLGLSRSTCTAILETLERRSWVERRADRTYAPGRGLIPVANAVRARLPILRLADEVMRAVLDDLGLEGLTLSLVEGDRLAQVARVGPHTGPDLGPLFQVPLHPPFGAPVMAFSRSDEQERWLSQVRDPASRAGLLLVLEAVRVHGVAVWKLDAVTELLTEAILASQALIDRLATAGRGGSDGRASLLGLFDQLGMSVADLAADDEVAVAYIEAPVFDPDGVVCYLLEAHVLRESVARPDLARIVERVRAAADELTLACGGVAPAFAPVPVPARGRQPRRTGTAR